MNDPLLGRQLASYRLLQVLGQGSFAQVYLGQHIHLDTYVAIKVLHAQLGVQDEQDFRREALLLAKLRNQHIVRILDYGIIDNRPFLITELAKKGSLNKIYPHGTLLPLPEIVAYTTQIADALNYAHERNIVHRDIKPENILVGDNDELLLADFGIAKLLGTSGSYLTERAAGTLTYMAPEQFMGQGSPASDQYALGVMVYEWLTGRFPFQGTAAEIIGQHVKNQPPPMRQFNPQVLPEVEWAVQTALKKDPDQRFRSVQAFANALCQAAQMEKQQVANFKVPPKILRQTDSEYVHIPSNPASRSNLDFEPAIPLIQSKPPLPFTTLPSLPPAQLTEFWWPTFIISTEQRRAINQGGLPSEQLDMFGQLPGFPSQPVPLPVSSSINPPNTGNLKNIRRISEEIHQDISAGNSASGQQAGAGGGTAGLQGARGNAGGQQAGLRVPRTTGQQSIKRTTGSGGPQSAAGPIGVRKPASSSAGNGWATIAIITLFTGVICSVAAGSTLANGDYASVGGPLGWSWLLIIVSLIASIVGLVRVNKKRAVLVTFLVIFLVLAITMLAINGGIQGQVSSHYY